MNPVVILLASESDNQPEPKPDEPKKDELTKKDRLEYVKLWMQQSQLFWSRLQTVAALHTGVLLGWYKSRSEVLLKMGILTVGMILSVLVFIVMLRDGFYMDRFAKLANASGEDLCPKIGGRWIGRVCGLLFVGILMFAELGLLIHAKWPHFLGLF
jgi:hypothetical protein